MIYFSPVTLKVYAKHFAKTLCENAIPASLIKSPLLKWRVDLTLFRMRRGQKGPPPPTNFSPVTSKNVGTNPPKLCDFYI